MALVLPSVNKSNREAELCIQHYEWRMERLHVAYLNTTAF